MNYNKEERYKFYVYILASKENGTLYTGLTRNIYSRTFIHKLNENSDSFTAKYKVNKLVYFEKHKYINNAIKRDKVNCEARESALG